MQSTAALDVSVIVPFSDDEEVIGTACRRLAAHLRALDLRFELLAVDQDSGDNCHALLALLRPAIPELRVTAAGGRDRGFIAGARQARGRVLWLVAPEAGARCPLAPFGRAFDRVARGAIDVVAVDRRFAVCHRTRALDAVDGVRSRPGYELRLARRARARRLTVEVHGLGPAEAACRRGGERRWMRLLPGLAPASARPGR
jgi:hypothetical protein